jgi:hypothetical protein
MKQEELLTLISTVNQLSKVALQVGVCLGVLISIIYCGVIGYYPAGMTIGDILFFVVTSLSFSFTYTLVVLALYCAGITFSPVFRWIQKAILAIPLLRNKFRNDEGKEFKINFPVLTYDKLPYVIVGLLVYLLVVIAYIKDFDKGFGLSLAILAMSFLYGAWNTKPLKLSAEKTELKTKVSTALLIALVPLIITKSQGNILNQAMSLVGARSEKVILQLPENYVSFLTQNKINADHKAAKNNGIYNNAKVLFRGIGEHTFVEIQGFRLVVSNKDLLIGKQVLTKSSN